MTPSSEMLSRLLSPMSGREFLDKHWGKEPVLIPGDPSKIESLFGRRLSWDDFYTATERASQFVLDGRPIEATTLLCGPGSKGQRDEAGGFLSLSLFDPREAPRLLAAGLPVTLPYVDWFIDDIARFALGLASDLVGIRDLVCIFTAAVEGPGVANHFDCDATLHFQIEGHKKWTISRKPELLWPTLSGVEHADGHGELRTATGEEVARSLREEDFVTYDVNPGDMLYLPPGTWHSAEVPSGRALAFELLFPRVKLSDVILRVLSKRLDHSEARFDVPVFLSEDSPSWSLPPESFAAFQSALKELQGQADSMSASDPELHLAWKQLATGSRQPPAPSIIRHRMTGTERLVTNRLPLPPVGPETRLRASLRGPLTGARTHTASSDELVLVQQGQLFPVKDARWIPVGLQLIDRGTRDFALQDALDWLPEADRERDQVARFLGELQTAGFLDAIPG